MCRPERPPLFFQIFFRIFSKLFFSLKTPPYFRLGVLFSFDGYRIPCENEKNIKKYASEKNFFSTATIPQNAGKVNRPARAAQKTAGKPPHRDSLPGRLPVVWCFIKRAGQEG
ncbi:hypothetical protein [Hominenteromicrobium sp.]